MIFSSIQLSTRFSRLFTPPFSAALLSLSSSLSSSRTLSGFQFRRNMSTNAPVCTDEFCLPSTSSAGNSAVVGAAAAPASDANKKVLKIDIVSDTVCPWCFVGKRRLEKALKQVDSSKVDVQIQWHPFQLNPSAPEVSEKKMEFYAKKFGSRAPALMANMKNVGAAENIQFGYTEKGRTGNTMKSHQVINLAYESGGVKVQNELVERLFKDYFEREEDITKEETLVAAAKSVGIDEIKTREALKSPDMKKRVEKEVNSAYDHSISGVPHFTINGKYEINGAQDSQVFLSLFQKLGLTN